MNERLKQLEKQAYVVKEYSQNYEYISGDTQWSETVFDREKFAELIVRECVGCCEQVISDPVPKSVDTWLNGGSQCIDEIKKHFGVEL